VIRRPLLAVPVVAALLLSGCGKAAVAAPRPVPTVLAPDSVLGGSLTLHLNTAPGTVAAFRQGKKESLIDQGQLWEIRRKDRLVGTLEIATVKSDVDLSKRKVRDQFTTPILVGARNDIRLLGQEVDMVQGDGGLSTLVWFGKGLFLVLQAKDPLIAGPDLAKAIIEHEQSRTEWQPLPQLYAPS
jgi:hypothetical protein